MKNILISWVLPTTRKQGGPLLPTDIKHVVISLSADGGANFTPVGTFTPDTLSAPVNDLPFGDQYVVRGWCVDVTDQAGDITDVPFTIVDDSAPGALAVEVTFP